jgi:outer membrane protein TolC
MLPRVARTEPLSVGQSSCVAIETLTQRARTNMLFAAGGRVGGVQQTRRVVATARLENALEDLVEATEDAQHQLALQRLIDAGLGEATPPPPPSNPSVL